MIVKQKKCKGIGKAIDFGCGCIRQIHKFGLCGNCFKDWIFNTENGKVFLHSTQLRARKQAEKQYRRERKAEKESVKNKSYYEKLLQKEINEIVRIIDTEKGCISCEHGWNGEYSRQFHAGHRFSVGSNPTLRFNILNIFRQCSICNNYKSGNIIGYDLGLLSIYGQKKLDEIKNLPAKYKSLHLSIEDLKEHVSKARNVKKQILLGRDFTREEINELIGIYK